MPDTLTSAPSHTPGPWHRNPSLDRTGHKLVFGRASGTPHNYLIADCGGVSHRSQAEMEANATLIAAAPDMLTALRVMVAAYREPGVPDEAQPAMVRAAIRAIERAEGGQ